MKAIAGIFAAAVASVSALTPIPTYYGGPLVDMTYDATNKKMNFEVVGVR